MRAVGEVLRSERLWDIARECLWRAQRSWRKSPRRSGPGMPRFTGTFRHLKYFQPSADFLESEHHADLVHVADLLCEGKVPLFGFGHPHVGLSPRWNEDSVSGGTWPDLASDALTVVRHDGTDVKVPWELSRLQFLPVLGKAFCVTKENRYRATACSFLDHWISSNPVGEGVNWTIAMEAALRAISICQTLNLLGPVLEDESPSMRTLVESLWEHFQFIEAHDEFSYFLTSNHYLSNIVGRFVVASHLEWGGAEKTRRELWEKIERESKVQVYADGGDYEASTGYHVLVTQLFTAAWRTAKLTSIPASPDFESRLARMHAFLHGVCDERGRVPQVGDCDDGRVEWTADDLQRFATMDAAAADSLACTDLVGLGRSLAGLPTRFFSATAEWYGLTQSVADVPRPAVREFSDSGVIRVDQGSAEMYFLAVPNGIGGKGSHTHNDKLSVLLTLSGKEFLSDSGTFCYTRDAAQRNRFRSTQAHCTLMVDGAEQNAIPTKERDLFRLANQARVRSKVEEQGERRTVVSGDHDGFSHLGVGHHRRCILEGKTLRIVDQLSGQGRHTVELSFIVAPMWRCALRPDSGLVAACAEGQVIMKTTAPCELEIQLGLWEISRVYGSLVSATRVAIMSETTFPIQITTDISWE